MTEPRTREALAVERDALAADIMAMMLIPPHTPAWSAVIMGDIAEYRVLVAEIEARGEAVRQGVG